MVLTDHKSLEHWAHEVLDTPSGPLGRRSRWHQILSKYDITVGYIPGKNNTVADILSRWAYPASQVQRDISRHGSVEDDTKMRAFLQEEKETERQCVYMVLQDPPTCRNLWIRGLSKKSRGGGGTPPPEPQTTFQLKVPPLKNQDAREEVSPIPTPPRRRAGEAGVDENSDG